MQQNSNITQNDNVDIPEPVSPEVQLTPQPIKKQGGWKSVLSTILIFILAPIIALLLINFVFQSYEVDGDSMETTLQNRDRLIVWKVPLTLAKITNKDYIPNRGDIIVFTKHGLYETSGGGDKQLIKRVIGIPGDRVVVSNGKITIYNRDNPDGFVPDTTLPYGADGSIPYTSGDKDVTIAKGEVFVSGDNRSNSYDSRSFGPIPVKDIIGKLQVRIFPFNKFQIF